MGETYRTHEEDDKCLQNISLNTEEKGQLKDLSVNRKTFYCGGCPKAGIVDSIRSSNFLGNEMKQ
jgi:hypothetical protein